MEIWLNTFNWSQYSTIITMTIGFITIIINLRINKKNRVQMYRHEVYKKTLEATLCVKKEADELLDIMIKYYDDELKEREYMLDSSSIFIFDKGDCEEIKEKAENKFEKLKNEVRMNGLFIPDRTFNEIKRVSDLYIEFTNPEVLEQNNSTVDSKRRLVIARNQLLKAIVSDLEIDFKLTMKEISTR
ncbi:hypothetical protein JOD24_001801 [Kroppenstedtia sanguinis]|uniref:hypothetical protein n=1 Tax=Kroppenstedtia sanguinis TaxID=1380684 RepID=UPI003D1EE639